MSDNNVVFLLLGTNLGDKKENLRRAIKQLEKSGIVIKEKSSIYETDPWGKTDQEDFLNQVIKIETTKSPINLLDTVLEAESNIGRVREEKWGARIIDIDILFFNNDIIETEKLTVPHPALHERRFTLMPLVEIAKHFTHPILHKTMNILLHECKDKLSVRMIV